MLDPQSRAHKANDTWCQHAHFEMEHGSRTRGASSECGISHTELATIQIEATTIAVIVCGAKGLTCVELAVVDVELLR